MKFKKANTQVNVENFVILTKFQYAFAYLKTSRYVLAVRSDIDGVETDFIKPSPEVIQNGFMLNST